MSPTGGAAVPSNVEELRAFALAQGLDPNDLPRRDPAPDRRVRLDGPYNFRDVGGYETIDDQRVRTGLLFRSDHLNELTDADRATLASLGIKVVHDFRLDVERNRQPSVLGDNPPEVVVLSLSDTTQLDESMIEIVRNALDGKTPMPPASYWEDSYDQILAVGRPMFVALVRSITGADRLPALYHCTGGKDRTGLATAMIQHLLGVDDETIVEDFLLTNLYRTPARMAALRAGFERVGVDPVAAVPVIGVTRAAIEKALRSLATTYGGVANYLLDGGLEPEALHRLRELLLEPLPADAG